MVAVIGRFHFVVSHVYSCHSTSQDKKNILLPISFLRVNKSSNQCLFSVFSPAVCCLLFHFKRHCINCFSPGEAEANRTTSLTCFPN